MANRTAGGAAAEGRNGPGRAHDLDLEPIRAAVEGLRYGEVRVFIQDGVIVQIERLEKQRLR